MHKLILLIALTLTGCAHLTTHTQDMKLDSQCLDVDDVQCMEAQGVRPKGAIKTWNAGETLHSADLNSNFSHIHNNMVGGHGGRLLDADVYTSANIASSKLASYRMIPRTWASLKFANAGCGTAVAACTIITGGSVTVAGGGAGTYNVLLGYTATDLDYGVTLSLKGDATVKVCDVVNITTTGFQIICKTTVPALSDVGWSFIVMDNN